MLHSCFHCNHDSPQATVYALKILLLLILTAAKNPLFYSLSAVLSAFHFQNIVIAAQIGQIGLLSQFIFTACFHNIAVRSFSFLSNNIVFSEFPGRHPDMFGELLVKMALRVIAQAVGNIRD